MRSKEILIKYFVSDLVVNLHWEDFYFLVQFNFAFSTLGWWELPASDAGQSFQVWVHYDENWAKIYNEKEEKKIWGSYKEKIFHIVLHYYLFVFNLLIVINNEIKVIFIIAEFVETLLNLIFAISYSPTIIGVVLGFKIFILPGISQYYTHVWSFQQTLGK